MASTNPLNLRESFKGLVVVSKYFGRLLYRCDLFGMRTPSAAISFKHRRYLWSYLHIAKHIEF